jgi:hypothetical protein
MGALAKALSAAQGEMKPAAKDSENPHFRSKYADLASLWEACRAALAAHGLAVLQPMTADGARLTVSTILVHESGEWVASELTLPAREVAVQALGSVATYGRRMGLAAMVGIAPGDADDDGEEAHGRKPAAEPVSAAKAKPKAASKPASEPVPENSPSGFPERNVKIMVRGQEIMTAGISAATLVRAYADKAATAQWLTDRGGLHLYDLTEPSALAMLADIEGSATARPGGREPGSEG